MKQGAKVATSLEWACACGYSEWTRFCFLIRSLSCKSIPTWYIYVFYVRKLRMSLGVDSVEKAQKGLHQVEIWDLLGRSLFIFPSHTSCIFLSQFAGRNGAKWYNARQCSISLFATMNIARGKCKSLAWASLAIGLGKQSRNTSEQQSIKLS